MLDPEEVCDQAQLTTMHQVIVLDGVLQRLRQRLEEEMPLGDFGYLVCTLAELEGQLLQWTRALMQWVQSDLGGVLDPEDE